MPVPIQSMPARRLGTVKQTGQAYPAFSEASLRWLIFNASQNGFDACVRRIGRKVLIDWDVFETWVDAQGGAK